MPTLPTGVQSPQKPQNAHYRAHPAPLTRSSRNGTRAPHQCKSDPFSAADVENTSPPGANPPSSAHEPRHVLPKDLPNAVQHFTDEELDRLLVVTLAEAKRKERDTTSARPSDPSVMLGLSRDGMSERRSNQSRPQTGAYLLIFFSAVIDTLAPCTHDFQRNLAVLR
jgi:hypothetical protein